MIKEKQQSIPIIDFYTRPGCHLCDNALSALKEIEKVVQIRLNEYNINEDDTLTEQFGMIIPVIKINGEIVQFGNVDMTIVKRSLLNKFF